MTQPFYRGLYFRLVTPVVLTTLVLGAGLYFFVLRAVSSFADRQINDTLAGLTRQVYEICDRNFTDLMQQGLVEDPRAVRIRKARTIEAIEDFMRSQRIQGLLNAPGHPGLIQTVPEVLVERLRQRPADQVTGFFEEGGTGYHFRHITFHPWQWDFHIVRDTTEYAPLFGEVRKTHLLTAFFLVLVVLSLVLALSRAVHRPLRQIIDALASGNTPDYRGTLEFEFLSRRIREMMASLEEKTDWLSRLYHIVLNRRGQSFFDAIAERIADAFGGNALICRIDPETMRLRIVSHRSRVGNEQRPSDELAGSPCEAILHSAEPIVVSQGIRELFPAAPYLAAAAAEAYIGFPLLDRDGRAMGVLQAFGPPHAFTRWDRNLFFTMGQLVAGEFEWADREQEERQLREQVFRTQKLESLGLLAGGIAHDFNNLLTAILGNISLARMDKALSEACARRLEAAEHAAMRAKGLTQQLLTFSKGGVPVKKEVARLDELIRETAEFSLRGASVGCEFRFAPALWPVEIDSGQFSQVIQNLVVNAQEAMPEGGRIFIEADNEAVTDRTALPLAPGRYVHMLVTDQGLGIDGRYLEKIFDPYFTTKKRGSGLGLAVCFSIIKKHDGHMAVRSEIGRGTTFDIYVPATDKSPAASANGHPQHHRGHGRILVMDDEPAVRQWIGEALEKMGYEPSFAENGEEAVSTHAVALAAQNPFRALIMDLTVPGAMGGRQALEQIRRRQPDAVAIVASGYSNDPVMAEFERYGFKAALPKPFDFDALARALQNVLSESA